MLGILRKQAKAFWVKVLLYAVALSFIIGFGAFSYVGKAQRAQSSTKWVAKVNDHVITRTEFSRAVSRYKDRLREQYGDQAEAYLNFLSVETMVLDQLIQTKLLEDEAAIKGIVVSDLELQKAIQMYPAFQNSSGNFDMQLYVKQLRRAQMTPQTFEDAQRTEMSAQNLRYLVQSSAKISDGELWDAYQANNDKAALGFIRFTQDTLKAKPSPSDEEVQAYFNSNAENFRLPEKRTFDYLKLGPADFTDQIELTDEAMQEYYNKNRDRLFKTEEQTKAAHILIKARKDDPQAIRDAARAMAVTVQKLATAPDADFGKLASEYSQDDSNKDKGGALGWFSREKMVPAFSDAAFAMSPGDVSGVIETTFGFHVIKVEERTEAGFKPLMEVAPIIRTSLTKERGMLMALGRAEEIFKEVPAGNSLSDYAEKQGLTATTAGPIDQKTGLGGVVDSARITGQAFQLKPQEISQPLRTNNFVYLIQVTDSQPERDAEFAEVAAQVQEKLVAELAKEQLRILAEGARMKLEAGNSGATVAAEYGLTVDSTGLFVKNTMRVPKLGQVEGLTNAAFELTLESPVAGTVLMAGDDPVVIWLSERQRTDRATFEVEKSEFRNQMMRIRENEVFSAWIEAALGRATVLKDDEFMARFAKKTDLSKMF
jgi:peptidyl-prolyl cis-trans isomerase D